MPYVIYMNRVHEYTTLHEDHCRAVEQHGGISTTYPPTGWYVRGLETKQGAEWVRALLSRAVGYRCDPCGLCKPSGKGTEHA